jgi:hypothetical protein
MFSRAHGTLGLPCAPRSLIEACTGATPGGNRHAKRAGDRICGALPRQTRFHGRSPCIAAQYVFSAALDASAAGLETAQRCAATLGLHFSRRVDDLHFSRRAGADAANFGRVLNKGLVRGEPPIALSAVFEVPPATALRLRGAASASWAPCSRLSHRR